jgi:ribosome recycling factor
MKIEVDEKKLVDEIEKLMKHYVGSVDSWFSRDFPELYWRVYIPLKTEEKRQ